jgi:nucleotide-binding universal stress UspA family protein
MYQRILLATDGSREGLVALREGALLAAAEKAVVFLLVIDRETPGTRMADGVYPIQRQEGRDALLAFGLSRLSRLGVSASGLACAGEPAEVIGRVAKRFEPALVVLGHRRQSLLDRWWSGSSGAYVVDNVNCSVLVARTLISDAEFETHLEGAAPRTVTSL